MNDTELIVLVDDDGQPIGQAPKLASHHAHTPLHLAFSCYVFRADGTFLLTQRAAGKKVWPGVWTNSVCGHPAPGEKLEDAVKRRLAFELGINEVDSIEMIVPDYRYTTPPFNGIIENELCPIFVARVKSDLKPNPEEVDNYEWLPWAEVKQRIASNPDEFSYWLKDQVPYVEKNPTFCRRASI